MASTCLFIVYSSIYNMPSNDFELDCYTLRLVDRDNIRKTHTVNVPFNCDTDCIRKLAQRFCRMEFAGTKLLALGGDHVEYLDFFKGSAASADGECNYAATPSAWGSLEPFLLLMAQGEGLVKQYAELLRLRSGGNARKLFGSVDDTVDDGPVLTVGYRLQKELGEQKEVGALVSPISNARASLRDSSDEPTGGVDGHMDHLLDNSGPPAGGSKPPRAQPCPVLNSIKVQACFNHLMMGGPGTMAPDQPEGHFILTNTFNKDPIKKLLVSHCVYRV